MKFSATINIKLKQQIKDAKGEAVSAVLSRIGLEDKAKVRIGKIFELEVNAENEDAAKTKLNKIIFDVLMNPIVETYEITTFEVIN